MSGSEKEFTGPQEDALADNTADPTVELPASNDVDATVEAVAPARVAGWHPNPNGDPNTELYWDGTAWTDRNGFGKPTILSRGFEKQPPVGGSSASGRRFCHMCV